MLLLCMNGDKTGQAFAGIKAEGVGGEGGRGGVGEGVPKNHSIEYPALRGPRAAGMATAYTQLGSGKGVHYACLSTT